MGEGREEGLSILRLFHLLLRQIEISSSGNYARKYRVGRMRHQDDQDTREKEN